MRLRTLFGLIIGSLTILLAMLPNRSPADGLDGHRIIQERISWWKADPRGKQYFQEIGPSTSPVIDGGTGGRGFSIHVAVEKVDPAAYDSPVTDLPAVLNDIEKMKRIAKSQNFTLLGELVNENATRAAFVNKLHEAAEGKDKLKAGDTLLITYSGHGSQIPDDNGDEDDDMDETWCLYDGHLIDDQLVDCWRRFDKGVRILIVLDSCHSSSAAKNITAATARSYLAEYKAGKKDDLFKNDPIVKKVVAQTTKVISRGGTTFKSRLLPIEASLKSYAKKAEEYKQVQLEVARNVPNLRELNQNNFSTLNPTVITLAGCRDSQESHDDNRNGFFSLAIDQVWDDGKFDKDYRSFLAEVEKRVRERAANAGKNQVPTFDVFGSANPAFEGQKPFSR